MRILSLQLKNFMKISEASLTFREGINVLHGDNGQGKSSVLEAVAFCVVGRTRGSSWKDFVKNGEDEFSIHLEMLKTSSEDDKIVFDYLGSISSGTCTKKIQYHGETHIGEKANKFLESIFDTKMLENTVFRMQGGVAISDMIPSDRRVIFEKIFNSSFDSIVEKIKADSEVAKAEEQKISNKIEFVKGTKYNYYTIIDPDVSVLQTLRSEAEAVQASEVVFQKYKFYKNKLNEKETLNTKLLAMKDKLSQAMNSKASIESSGPGISQDKEALKLKQKALAVALEKIDEELAEEQKKLAVLVETKNNSVLSKKEDSLLKHNKELSLQEASHHGNITVIQTHIKAHDAGECPTCGQATTNLPVGDFHAEVEDLKSRIQSINNLVGKNNEEINLERANIKDLEAKVYAQEAKVKEVQQKVVQAEKEISKAESDIKLKDQEYSTLTDKVSTAQEKINEVTKDTQLLETQLEDLDSWCKSNVVVEPEAVSRPYDLIQKEINDIIEKVQLAKTQREQNELTVQKEAEDKKQIALLTEDLNTYQLKIKGLKELSTIFSNSFPAFINLKAATLLQGFMNGFFETVKPGFYVNLQQSKKGLEFLYKAGDEKEWGLVSMLSGFEKSLLDLGFTVSVAKATGNTLILLDEPDGAASEESSDRLFKTLTSVTGFEQLFVITHKPPVMDYLRDNGALVYTVDNGEFSLAG